MCFKPSLQYKVIVLCGLIVAAFGVIMLVMAINISVKSAWLTDFLSEADETGSLTGMVKAFQAVVYVIGIYLLIIGGASLAVCK
jgi:multisubunit Na+/H+ antiporter MnhB subunit